MGRSSNLNKKYKKQKNMKQENEQAVTRKPTLVEALIPIVFMVIALIVGIFIYGADPHIPLLLSAGVATIIAFRLGFKWTEIEQGMLRSEERRVGKESRA